MKIAKPESTTTVTLVLGKTKSGKTRHAVGLAKGKTLFIALANTEGVPADMDVLTLAPEDDIADIGKLVVDGKYQTVIVDGLVQVGQHVLTRMGALQPSQAQWGQMSNTVAQWLNRLRLVANVIGIIGTTEAEGKTEDTDLNPALWKLIAPTSNAAHYTACLIKGADVAYTVQTNTALAVRFKPEIPVSKTPTRPTS